MKLAVKNLDPAKFQTDLLVFILQQKKKKKEALFGKSNLLKKLAEYVDPEDFCAKKAQSFLIYPQRPQPVDLCKAKRILLLGIGDQEVTSESLRESGGKLAQHAKKLKATDVTVVVPEQLSLESPHITETLCEGFGLGTYQFTKYKKQQPDDDPVYACRSLTFLTTKAVQTCRKHALRAEHLVQAVCRARDMANEPGNAWTADHFAHYAKDLAKQHKLQVTVFNKAALQKMKMGGILGVNQGTAQPPQLVALEYRTGKKVPVVMLVGKGLTFDSGGISIKPSAGMQDMKYDMCGGAAVIAAMEAIAREKPTHVDVVALVPATDNMPGPAALKPGDVIRQYDGTTVEIISTDAEGRLILADALAYGTKKYKPDAVIDVATLTGAVIVALGHHRTGLMSNNEALAEAVTRAGEATGEPVWRLPLAEEYAGQLKSQVADLKNVGDKGAGSITAGEFLQKFVGKTPWAHLDIAGTAWDFTDKPYIPKGPSGVGVRLLVELIRSWKKH